jgi:hypothetical protein
VLRLRGSRHLLRAPFEGRLGPIFFRHFCDSEGASILRKGLENLGLDAFGALRAGTVKGNCQAFRSLLLATALKAAAFAAFARLGSRHAP